MGAQRNVQDEMAGAADTSGEERIVRLDGGIRWRASVVARLISEDIAAGVRRACHLVLHVPLSTHGTLRRIWLIYILQLKKVPTQD